MIKEFTKDAEIVMYQAENFEPEPKTPMGKFVENPTTSLWLREDGEEFPIFSHSEFGSWNNPDPDFHKNADINTVSEEFIEAVGKFLDPMVNGFTGVDKDVWEGLTAGEKYLIGSLREGIKNHIPTDSPQYYLIEICEQKIAE